MPPKSKGQKPKTSSPRLTTPEEIRKLANKKGVTIYLDIDGSTEQALRNSIYSYSRKNKTLSIVAPLLGAKDKALLLELIKKVFTGEGLILKKGKEEVLESYTAYVKANPYQYILDFFEPILTRDDFQALKMGLFLRREKDRGNNVHRFKQDIRERFGDRGANIANLCSAGYFENEFMPIYNAFPKEIFNEYYQIAVGEKARALFVHSSMSKEDLAAAFDEILGKVLKYHMGDFRVHGLNAQNVKNIKEFFATKTTGPDEKYVIIKGFEKTDPIAIEYLIRITQYEPPADPSEPQ